MNNKYKEYAMLRVQSAEIATRMKAIETDLVEEIKDLSVPMKTEYGTFSGVNRTVNEFSETAKYKIDEVKTELKKLSLPLQNEIKEIERKDIESGNGEQRQVVSLRYSLPKETAVKLS